MLCGSLLEGGRGKTGGVRDAARKAGVPQRTAQRKANKLSQKENGSVSPDPAPPDEPIKTRPNSFRQWSILIIAAADQRT